MRLAKVKHFIANVIEPKKKASALSIIYNILMSIIVIASCAFVFVDLFTEKETYWNNLAAKLEIVAVIIFASEYVLKLFVSEVLYEGQGWFKSKISYITSFDSLIDIVCILSILLNKIPTEFSMLRLLKLVKLTRLVKLKNAIDEIREDGVQKEEKKGFRYRIYEIIAKDEKGDVASKIYDIFSVIIILLSVTIVILDSFEFPDQVEKTLFICEVVFTVFFAIEYVARVWTADYAYPDVDKDHAKMKYIFSFLAIIDLLSILPIFFTFSQSSEASMPNAVAVLKIFKLFRIARLLKASRYLNGINIFVESIKNKKKQIFFSVVVLVFLLMLCSVLLYSFESAAEDSYFKNGFSGIVYLLKVLSGLGGDEALEALQTVGGKVMVAIMIICGGCVVGVPIGIISGEFENMVKTASDDKDEETDLFEEFASKLTNEQKIAIIAQYGKEVKSEEKPDESN